MSMYAVDGEILNGIAHAIQSKTGSDEPMTVASMASAIEGISGGSGIPFASKMSCGTYIPENDGRMGVYFNHNLGAIPKLFLIYTNDIDTSDVYTIAWEIYVSNNLDIQGAKKAVWFATNGGGTDTTVYRTYATNYGVDPGYMDESKIYINGIATQYHLKPFAQYHWIALA